MKSYRDDDDDDDDNDENSHAAKSIAANLLATIPKFVI